MTNIDRQVGEWIKAQNNLQLYPMFYSLAEEIFGSSDPFLLSEDERQERLLNFFDRALTLAQQNIHAHR